MNRGPPSRGGNTLSSYSEPGSLKLEGCTGALALDFFCPALTVKSSPGWLHSLSGSGHTPSLVSVTTTQILSMEFQACCELTWVYLTDL